MRYSIWGAAVSCLLPAVAVAVGSVEVLTVRINTGYCAPPGGSRSTVGFLSAGNGTISGLLPTIATGSVSDCSFGPFGTTTGPGSGPSASPSPLTCPIRNNTIYINDFGTEYNAFCGRDLIGDAAIPSHTDTFEKCLDFCDIFGGRAGYAKGPGLLLSGLSIKGPAINEFVNRVLCPALDNQTITDPFNESYLIGCGKTLSGNADIAPAILKSLAACLLYCSLDDDCLAVTFTGYPPPATGAGVSYNCFPRSSAVSGLRKRQDEVISSEPGSQFAIRVSRDQGGGGVITSGSVPGGVASTQATEQVPSGTGGSFAVSGNSTQTGGSFSPTRTAGNSTQTGGSGSASSTGTTVPSVTGGFGNATGTSTGVAPPTPSNTLSCSGSSNTQYTDEFNTSYNVTCGLDITGSPAVASHADTFNKCISFCDILSGCAGVTYQTPSASTDSNCHPYSSFTGYSSIPGPSSLLAAIPAKGGLVNNSFSYDQLCPGRAGQSVTDRYGVRYTIGCGEVISGTDLPSTVLRSLNACLLYCSLFGEGCAAVDFTGYPPGLVPSSTVGTRKRQANPANCFPKSSTGPVEVVVPQEGASYAKRVSPALPVGSGDSTAVLGASSTSGISGGSTSGASGISTSSVASPPASSASGNSTITVGPSSSSDIAGNSTSGISTSSIAGSPASSASRNSTINAEVSSSSAVASNPTSAAIPRGSSTSGVAGNSTSVIIPRGSSYSGVAGNSNSAIIPRGSSTSAVQPLVSTTSGRLPFNPSSIRAPLGNSTSGRRPTGSATSVFSL